MRNELAETVSGHVEHVVNLNQIKIYVSLHFKD